MSTVQTSDPVSVDVPAKQIRAPATREEHQPNHSTGTAGASNDAEPQTQATIGMPTPSEAILGVEVDLDDGDSGIAGVDTSTLSQSVRSSVYEFVEENGRTYHRYKEGQYFLPNDESEQERLDLQHHLFLLTFNNQLYLSPAGQLHNVLDIGTGTGIWAIDFALRHPSAHVTGTDLSPIQPASIPPNCTFLIDDAEEDDWLLPTKFDLIHGRALASCFKDAQKVIDSAVKSLVPGTGWLEFQDLVLPMGCVDDSWEGSTLQRWNNTMVECAGRVGRDLSYSQRYRAMFAKALLVDVQERHFLWPSNTWVKGRHYKKIATWFLKDLSDGLEAISLQILTRVAGMSKEEVTTLLEDVRKDLADPKIHAYMRVTVTMGRKAA
ncbi:S-adenosyl-L-methionine-dependent methyltransferase [Coniochaeta sp. 2T2.1]|nr:S-adenosyl-L-methionine-dependent methyltransferase [Coniochaeta sp. 2T2.1]